MQTPRKNINSEMTARQSVKIHAMSQVRVNRRVVIGGVVILPGRAVPDDILSEHGKRLEAIGAIPKNSARSAPPPVKPAEKTDSDSGDDAPKFFKQNKKHKE